MRVLQLCYKMPYPLKDGGEYSIHSSALSLLSQPDTEVKVLAMNTKKNWVDPNSLPTEFRTKTHFECVEIDTRIKSDKLVINLFSSKSYLVERFYTNAYEQKIAELLTKNEFDIVQIEHLYLCVYLKIIREHFKGKVVLRAQNVEFQLWESYRSHSKNLLEKWYLGLAIRRLRKFETTKIKQLDGIINLSLEDQQIYRQYAPKVPSKVIPIGFNHTLLKENRSPESFNKQIIVYHLGSMDWRPNIQGIQWFIHEVFPILVELQPDVQVRFAGKKMPEKFYSYQSSNLRIDGEVENALIYQEDKEILIVPLLSGGGVRVKIIQALALGKSIVSTTIGAQGIDYSAGEIILIADQPQAFAQAIIQCINSSELRTKLSKNGNKLAEDRYNLDSVGRQKITFYNELLSLK